MGTRNKERKETRSLAILWDFTKSFFRPIYDVNDVFMCKEKIPPRCPTFVERDVLKKFSLAIRSNNIIVVYGESKQGKTWAIEKYCKKQIRISCNASMDIASIKKTILGGLGYSTIVTEHTSRTLSRVSGGVNGKAKTINVSSSASVKGEIENEESETSDYPEVDIDQQNEFMDAVKDRIGDSFIVMDNFHYLPTAIQQSFCSLLRDFNYHCIKVIIVGIWKEASRITSYASDLVGRCSHIDIGSWRNTELQKVAELGQSALNIKINENIIKKFIKQSVHNVGIFKAILLVFCAESGIYKTQRITRYLDDQNATNQALTTYFEEAFNPLRDRLVNLATPKRENTDSKHMRRKIVIALLKIIEESTLDDITKGIELDRVLSQIHMICSERGEPDLPNSNITQELGLIHTREENKQTQENFIPIFFYDTANRKVLVLEPTLYFIKMFHIKEYRQIIKELCDE